MPWGFVLAGGGSRRMGRDKAMLAVHGEPMLRKVAEQVRQASGSVTLIAPPELYAGLGFEVVADSVPPCGPAGGILTALELGRAQWNLVAACDMPALDSGLLRRLLEEASTGDGLECVAACHPRGDPEPLCAVYSLSVLPLLRREIGEGRLKMRDLLKKMRVSTISASADSITNVNTPEDWANHAESGA
ncbi:MAG: molybdenum cofactor guanylyltransferase [Bryobacteraceae bacterium]|nr:molybdenum cofactor guanylyltransferase [Bryobacteraceae bacterium]